MESSISRGLEIFETNDAVSVAVNGGVVFQTPTPPVMNDIHVNADTLSTGTSKNLMVRKVRQYSSVEGQVPVYLGADTIGILLKNIFGTNTTDKIFKNGVEVADVEVSHFYGIDSNPTPLQVHIRSEQEGSADSSGRDIYHGCQIKSVKFMFEEGDAIKVEIDIMGVGKILGHTNKDALVLGAKSTNFSPFDMNLSFGDANVDIFSAGAENAQLISGDIMIERKRSYSALMGQANVVRTHDIMASGSLVVEGDKGYWEKLGDENNYKQFNLGIIDNTRALGDAYGADAGNTTNAVINRGVYISLDKTGFNVDSVDATTEQDVRRTISFMAYSNKQAMDDTGIAVSVAV